MSENLKRDIQNAVRDAKVFTEAEKNIFERVREMNEKLHNLIENNSLEYIDPSIINWIADIYVIGYERGLRKGWRLGGFMPSEIQDILVEYGQHDERFSWGDRIKYSPSEVYDILKKEESKIENGFN